MPAKPLELFYSYAREDETLRDQLNDHLALLRKQGFISTWHDREINAGSLWADEISRYLRSARIILLLVSRSFIASDYCYGVEMQEALRRAAAGEARVIPVILKPCDWESAPISKLTALPKDGKAVTLWTNREAAFTNIAKEIRRVVNQLNGMSDDSDDGDDGDSTEAAKAAKAAGPAAVGGARKRGGTRERESTMTGKQGANNANDAQNMPGSRSMPEIPATPVPLKTPQLKKAIGRYYQQLEEYKGKADYELAVRNAFQNLLAETARLVRWTLIPEETLANGARPDGTLRDDFLLKRGYWEAKGPKSDLDREIAKKIANGYPLTNIIFENTRTAVLYQNKTRSSVEFQLDNPNDVGDLLKQFFGYVEPHIENFEEAVNEFKERIPELAANLLTIIEKEHKGNKQFNAAFDTFAELCRSALDPKISTSTIDEMLVQHLLTERLFRTVFDNPDFVNRNAIAAEIEKVVRALASRSFNRNEFLKSLDRFYVAIEAAAKSIDSWSERQQFLNTVYERFFQGFSIKQADTHGVVYTPQEIVDFMCASVEEVLRTEFGTSIEEPGVQILDPSTGTGSFIVNLVHRIPRHRLQHKYRHDLFCNEIMLLPYYIASLNIEHEYYAKMGQYEPFEGICFADTLELAEGQQLPLFVEENTERVQREKDAKIMVVIGNPPYNVGQKSENDNNKNRKYPKVDERIKDTYVMDSEATLKTQLYDAYVRFFRWAADRLQGRDGVVCLVTNNSFIDQFAFDGMRRHLLKDFTQIYHLDLHGNVRKNPKLSGTTHNVFGIQIGVGITIAIRASQHTTRKLYYYRVPESWRKVEKLSFLKEKNDITKIDWIELQPDERHSWITSGLQPEFSKFLSVGAKDTKNLLGGVYHAIFNLYSGGVKTNRDLWVYDFNHDALVEKIKILIETYNSDVDRWLRRGNSKTAVDDFVTYDDKRIKWSGDLKLQLTKGHHATFSEENIRHCLYRPFVKQYLYFDGLLNNSIYLQHLFFPKLHAEAENIAIWLKVGSEWPMFALAVNAIPDLLPQGGSQCFPYYTYAADGSNRRENITDWALKQFQQKYGAGVSKWDIFHYVYGMLHHPHYRQRYAENLKRDLPHIPLLNRPEAFEVCVRVGRQLMDLHLHYEQAREYPLQWVESENVPFSWRVEKMRLTADHAALVVNESLTLAGVPPACFEYRLGNRSALEWIIDQYQVSRDKRSGIESDPNPSDEDQQDYIVRLVGRVVTVSVETVKLVGELANAVHVEDWLDEAVDMQG